MLHDGQPKCSIPLCHENDTRPFVCAVPFQRRTAQRLQKEVSVFVGRCGWILGPELLEGKGGFLWKVIKIVVQMDDGVSFKEMVFRPFEAENAIRGANS
ncbi:hypothetical protein CDAR_313051 [Caerostris darwini]|uniref:Uncharacterized protein n=1 Tax=Caerostris darwini TaxID=1538125 RepID=A0AAV4S0G4_9ARAC|nr:hypothetical protein CDAR_313051 [Caerostris darwini]